MSGLYNQQNQNLTQRDNLLRRCASARNDMLLIFIFTIINIVCLVANGNMYMLFSANIPYSIVDFGMFFCGMYPDEFYTGEYADMVFLDKGAMAIFAVIAIVITSLYLLAYIFSKNQNKKWYIVALVLISLDTAFMMFLYEPGIAMIPDIAFHIWMIVATVRGIIAIKNLEELPPEPEISVEYTQPEYTEAPRKDLTPSTPIRMADLSAKSKILLEDTVYGHKVVYRRVKNVNELVIDNYVYAEYIAWAEMAHMLSAVVDNHTFCVGFDSIRAQSYIMVDGVTVKNKIRLI